MIRHAKIADRPALVDLLVDFSAETPIDLLKDPVFNYQYVVRTIDIIQRSGLVLVSEHAGEITGMLIAQIVGDIWMPDRKYMKEICWYVKPEHRGGSAGYRLLRAYEDHCEELIRRHQIQAYGLTTLSTSPDLNLTKRGWQRVETDWVKE